MEEVSSWSHLPQALLELILKSLTLPNYLRFGSVCRSWRTVQTECLHLPAQDLPFLFLRSRSIKSDGTSMRLLSLLDKKIYKKQVPRRFCIEYSIPSSHGWLVMYDPDKNIKFLYNPFIINNRCIIDLPPKAGIYSRCLFFSTPADSNGVLLVTKANYKFLLCRLKDMSNPTYEWKEFAPFSGCEETDFISNFIVYRGKLYALIRNWSIAVVHLLFPQESINVKMKLGNTHSKRPANQYVELFLLESCGELLMVRVWCKHPPGFYVFSACSHDFYFDVFLADLTKLEWVKLENLGDQTLFLSGENSVSVCVKGSNSDFKANRIYYVYRNGEYFTPLGFDKFIQFDFDKEGSAIHSITTPDGSITNSCSWLG